MGFVKVFLLDLDFGNFVKSGAGEEVILSKSQYLLKIENGIVEVVDLFKSLGFVEVSFAKGD